MARGKIDELRNGYGFIRPDEGKGRVFFHSSALARGLRFDDLNTGDAVEFEAAPDERGLKATSVRQVSGAAAPEAAGAPAGSQKVGRGYRFLNPYNFVRYLPDRPSKPDDPPEVVLLGRCPPPPHDRWAGLSGRITCQITAATPVFVSDSEGVEGDDHKTYRFFECNGEPAIPASSLRGMIRSVFEAVTNSCFSSFQEDKPYPLEHREARAPEMFPARVLSIDKDGNALLEMLDCTLNAPVDVRGRPTTTRAGAVIQAYPPRVKDPRTERTFNQGQSHLPPGAHDGMRVAALVRREPVVHRSGRFRSFQVERLVPAAQHASLHENPQVNKRIFGWLHLTGPNIENKHDERLFFRWDDDRRPEPPQMAQIPKSYLLQCDGDVAAEYNQHLKEYWERNERDVRELGNKRWPASTERVPHPSTFIEKGRKLKPDDLVYVQRDARGQVTMLRPVSMPRVRYVYSRQALLPRHLDRCKEYDNLCPACRVFGWVSNMPIEKGQRIAYAGRVRLSHAAVQAGQYEFESPKKLAILSTPKPTTTTFYLLRADGRPGDATYDAPDARLRGRKFYRHFGSTAFGNWSEAAPDLVEPTDQNRTLSNPVKSGSRFTFQLEFENLAEVELGALLWALELEDGMYNRIGFGKPLGLGSVQIEVQKIEVFDPQTLCSELEGGWHDRLSSKLPWINAFKSSLGHAHGRRFDDLLNVRDLRALLSEPPLPHVHYPRSGREPTAEGENFKWFVGNKRRKPEQGGPLKLELAENDTVGLPLHNERGEEVDVK
jgi:CRISPR-associated protein (TIGR03986 family)